MPMRNAEPYLETALRSILEAGPDLELLVVDDGSTDRSRELIEKQNDSRIRVVDGPQRGVAASFNTALRQAKGEIVMRCDADDCYAPGRVKWQAEWLEAGPEYIAVCGGFSTMDDDGKHVASMALDDEAGEITEELKHGRARTHLGTYAIRRWALEQTGGSREWFRTTEDVDLQFRLGELGPVWYEPRRLYCYRLHDKSITHTAAPTRRAFEDWAARHFALQRRQDGADDLMRGRPPAPPDETLLDRAPTAASQLQSILLGRAWRERASKGRAAAVALGFRACAKRPWDVKAWRSWLALSLRG